MRQLQRPIASCFAAGWAIELTPQALYIVKLPYTLSLVLHESARPQYPFCQPAAGHA